MATVRSVFHPEHSLARHPYPEGSAHTCAVCDLGITGADGYRCDGCDFHMHELCSRPPCSVSTDQHRQHALNLYSLGASRPCNVCGETCRAGGYLYCCVPCDYSVHPRCLPRPPPPPVPRDSSGVSSMPTEPQSWGMLPTASSS